MVRVRYDFSSRRNRHIENIKKQKPKIPDLIDKLIKISDVILEVIDARFIQDTRNIEIENMIKKLGKRIIYVINKSDLIALKQLKEKLEKIELKPYVLVSCKYKKGVNELRTRIKIEISKIPKEHERFHVAVIGYPNTGKSSLINLLTGRGYAKVASEAGFTKGIQKIRLFSDVLLLDSPGIIPKRENLKEEDVIAKHARIGVRTYDKIKEPDLIVLKLTKQYPGIIEKFYGFNLTEIADVNDFIEKLGRKKNFLKKGNQVDEDKTSRLVLRDIQE